MGLADDLEAASTTVRPSLREWVDSLPSEDRSALYHYAAHGMPIKQLHDAAREHGCPVAYAHFARWVQGVRDGAR